MELEALAQQYTIASGAVGGDSNKINLLTGPEMQVVLDKIKGYGVNSNPIPESDFQATAAAAAGAAKFKPQEFLLKTEADQ